MVPGILETDSKNVYDALLKNAPYMGMTEKMVGLELQGTAQLIGARQLECRWVNGDAQLANPLTKPGEKHQLEDFYSRGGKWRLVMDPQLLSAKKR
eukprot:3460064-Lingulodinium_polyedra.AAC.1